MELKLKNKKLTTIGGSRGFIIEAAYFNNKQILEEKEYDLTIVPSKSEEQDGHMIRKKPLSPKELKEECNDNSRGEVKDED